MFSRNLPSAPALSPTPPSSLVREQEREALTSSSHDTFNAEGATGLREASAGKMPVLAKEEEPGQEGKRGLGQGFWPTL